MIEQTAENLQEWHMGHCVLIGHSAYKWISNGGSRDRLAVGRSPDALPAMRDPSTCLKLRATAQVRWVLVGT